MRNLIGVVCIVAIAACQPSRLSESTRDATGNILDNLLYFEDEGALAETFGGKNISRDTISPAGGRPSVATVLFANTAREVYFLWNDSIHFSSLNAIVVRKTGSSWQTREGISIGTSLSQLVTINEKEVGFTGLGYKAGAGMVSWNDGVLANRRVQVVLRLPEQFDADHASDSLLSEQRVSSEWAISRRINPVVGEIALLQELEH
jgi:hypothetical protein